MSEEFVIPLAYREILRAARLWHILDFMHISREIGYVGRNIMHVWRKGGTALLRNERRRKFLDIILEWIGLNGFGRRAVVWVREGACRFLLAQGRIAVAAWRTLSRRLSNAPGDIIILSVWVFWLFFIGARSKRTRRVSLIDAKLERLVKSIILDDLHWWIRLFFFQPAHRFSRFFPAQGRIFLWKPGALRGLGLGLGNGRLLLT
jgi:hypothetical protein